MESWRMRHFDVRHLDTTTFEARKCDVFISFSFIIVISNDLIIVFIIGMVYMYMKSVFPKNF